MAHGGAVNFGKKVLNAVPGIIGGGAQAVGQGISRGAKNIWNLAESAKSPALHKAIVTGEPEMTRQFPIFSTEQQDALSQILQQALGQYKNVQTDFAPIAEQARNRFEQQTIPSLAERFTALGAEDSSAFPQQLGQEIGRAHV